MPRRRFISRRRRLFMPMMPSTSLFQRPPPPSFLHHLFSFAVLRYFPQLMPPLHFAFSHEPPPPAFAPLFSGWLTLPSLSAGFSLGRRHDADADCDDARMPREFMLDVRVVFCRRADAAISRALASAARFLQLAPDSQPPPCGSSPFLRLSLFTDAEMPRVYGFRRRRCRKRFE